MFNLNVQTFNSNIYLLKSILKMTFTHNVFEDWKFIFLPLKADFVIDFFINKDFFQSRIIIKKNLTQVLNGVVSLFVVHFNGLGMRAADPIADGVTPHHNVLVLRGRPAHYNAVHKWPHMQGAGDVWHSCLWNQRTSKITLCHPNQTPVLTRYLPVFTIQIALKRLSRGPVCGRTRAVDRNGRHSQHIFSASLQTWKIQEEL